VGSFCAASGQRDHDDITTILWRKGPLVTIGGGLRGFGVLLAAPAALGCPKTGRMTLGSRKAAPDPVPFGGDPCAPQAPPEMTR